uniref:Uncharacterized protein n=1 Tax=Heterorhabditis bacteriophora TaxID=37862 RepID=A0A1I7WF22_HETBA
MAFGVSSECYSYSSSSILYAIQRSEIIISTYLLLTQILVNCVRVSLLLIN